MRYGVLNGVHPIATSQVQIERKQWKEVRTLESRSTIRQVSFMLVVLLSSATGLVLLGVSLAGLGLAPAFPTTIALFTERFGREASRLTGTLFMLAGLGAAVFPWIVGAASTHYHGLRVGLIVPLVGGLLMLAIHGAIMATLPSRE